MESISINAVFPYSQFVQALGVWFQTNQRDLPWRHPKNARDAYRVLVSEVMLQQTTVKAVVPFYTRFLERFPDVQTLANATIEDVLPFWAGLGYYSRARMLYQCAQTIVEKHDTIFPQELDRVLDLPGVGRYTAGAVTSIAFDAKNPIVDANVARVFSRIFLIDGDLKNRANQTMLWHHASEVVQNCDEQNPPSQTNPAMMELGALVCTPKNPKCEACPVHQFCGAFATNRQSELPFIAAKREAVLLNDACAFTTQKSSTRSCETGGEIVSETRVLLRQRAHEPGIWWRGMWELPRTTIANNETAHDALQRLFRDELEIDNLTFGEKIKSLRHGVTHHDITLDCYEIGDIEYSNQLETVRWFSWSEIENLALPSTMKRLLDWLQARENQAQKSLF